MATNTLHRSNPFMRLLVFLNYKMSLIGASGMAGVVYMVNIDYGYLPAGIAASKQFLYTFIIGGFILKILEAQIKWYKSNLSGVMLAVFITSALTTILVYSVHNLKGTPEPFYSTVPTIFFAPIGFMAVVLQKKYIKKESYLQSKESFN